MKNAISNLVHTRKDFNFGVVKMDQLGMTVPYLEFSYELRSFLSLVAR